MKIYTCKDGRLRVYDPSVSSSVISYPRILMAQKLGRPLEPYEQVHHIDGNALNNSLENLEIVQLGMHQAFHARKYFDKVVPCAYCGVEYLWTALQQRYFYSRLSRVNNKSSAGPFCSRVCSGKYGRQEQLSRNR